MNGAVVLRPRLFLSRTRRFPVLERLVLLALVKIHPDADNDHSNGEAYSPDERDKAGMPAACCLRR